MATQLAIRNYGRVKLMPFPDGWQEEIFDRSENSQRQIFSVSHPDYATAKFGFYNRGGVINRYIAIDFITILQMGPHSLTPYEVEIVEAVLRTMADQESFKIETLETVLINGQSMLHVEGVWLLSGLREKGYFFNVDERAEYVQEIHFFASEAEFEKLVPSVRDCINAVVWF